MNKPKNEKPKVFISYAWTSQAYVNAVASFASKLLNDGIDVLFDKFDMTPGNELNDFMERSVKDPSVSNVIILLNKNYQEKADKREGGVGKETQILSEEVYNKVNQTKIIPVVFEKGSNGEIYKPKYLASTFYVDLTDEEKYDSEYKLLCKTIYGEPVYRKPEVGATPNWVTEAITFEPELNIKFSSFKKETNKEVNAQNYIESLKVVEEEIVSYQTDNINSSTDKEFCEQYLGKYIGLKTIRDEFLELVKLSIYVEKSEQKIARFFENTYSSLYRINKNNKEMLQILLHELFIYTIAYFLKMEKYNVVGYLLGKSYIVEKYGQGISSFSVFYSSNHNILDTAIKNRDNKNYFTGTGTYWIQNINIEFCSKEEFVLADDICFNYYIYSENNGLDMHWFPITYIYGDIQNNIGVLALFARKLKTKEFLASVLTIFNYETLDAFEKNFKEVEKKFNNGELRDYRYQGSFDSAPLLCHYVKSEDIGKFR